MAEKEKENYVDPKILRKELTVYSIQYKKYKEELENGDDEAKKPRASEYLGDCIMKIAVHLSYSKNFRDYPYIGDMVSDGIEDCLRYMHNFKPDLSNSNPFSYLTTINYWAFVRRIENEKKKLYVKLKETVNVNIMHMTSDCQEHDIGTNYNDGVKYGEWSQEYVNNFIDEFEAKYLKKKKLKEEKEKLKNAIRDN